MTEHIDRRFFTQTEAKVAQIQGTIPGLMYLRAKLHKEHLSASAVVLPAHMDPGPYDGPDATDAPATLLGLPIVWGDRVGLVIEA